MARNKNSSIHEWISDGLKGLAVCVSGLIVFSYQQLNSTMRELTSVTRAIELRVTSIEVDRNAGKEQYKNFMQDVQNMKTDMMQVKERMNVIADFLAKISAPAVKKN